jgi:protein-L-isoaspartate(D-aspartate) O-methyltransferase
MNKVRQAMEEVDRELFLPENMRTRVGEDAPLPIGYGQTNSQPSTVRYMLEWLDVQPGERVLDVGSGSGWTTALLGHLAGKDGKVYAVERVPQLVRFGRHNCQAAGIENVSFFQASQTLGLPEKAPFHKILVSAGAQKLPLELVRQLKTGGKMVIPVGHAILEITKVFHDELKVITHEGFIFVPLIEEG